MNWFTLYAAVGIAVAMLAAVVCGRHRSDATGVALLAGLCWPAVAIALLQLGLWVGLHRVAARGRGVAPVAAGI